MSERFYVNRELGPGLVVLQGAEAHHVAAVRRFRPGDVVYLFNGDGREYRAEILTAGRRSVELNVLETLSISRELGYRLVVACPLPRGDRGQFLIEKLTELGATTYVPLRTERSVLHPGESRQDRLQRYVQEASKQCGRNVLMRIEEVTEWKELVRQSGLPERRWLGHAAGSAPAGPAGDTAIGVGPEGGLTEAEVRLAQEAGWQPMGLGTRTLRIETAALALAVAATLP